VVTSPPCYPLCYLELLSHCLVLLPRPIALFPCCAYMLLQTASLLHCFIASCCFYLFWPLVASLPLFCCLLFLFVVFTSRCLLLPCCFELPHITLLLHYLLLFFVISTSWCLLLPHYFKLLHIVCYLLASHYLLLGCHRISSTFWPFAFVASSPCCLAPCCLVVLGLATLLSHTLLPCCFVALCWLVLHSSLLFCKEELGTWRSKLSSNQKRLVYFLWALSFLLLNSFFCLRFISILLWFYFFILVICFLRNVIFFLFINV
jgi:hypothetical protein